MVLPQFKNNASTKVNGVHSAGSSTITVVDASLLPTLGIGESFYITLWNAVLYSRTKDDPNMEVVEVTGITGNDLTLSGVTLYDHNSNDNADNMLTEDFFNALETDIAAIEGDVSQNANDISTNASDISTHVADTENPHSTTKDQVGLGNVTNDAQLKISQLETTITDDDSKVPSSGSVVDYAVKRTEVNWSTSNEEPLNMIPYIRDDSVMEVGRYIDFHTTGSLTDHDIRLDCETADQLTIQGGNLNVEGTVTLDKILFGLSNAAQAWAEYLDYTQCLSFKATDNNNFGDFRFYSEKTEASEVREMMRINGDDSTIEMGGNRLTNVGTPIDSTDATNKNYVDGRKPRAYVWLPAEAAYVPATNPAELSEEQGSTVYAGYATLNFDDTIEEHAIWKIPMPDYDGNGISIKAHIVLGTAPTGDTNVQFNILTIGVTDAENLLSPTTVDTGTNITLSVTSSYTTSMMAEGSALVNPSNVAADDIMVLELSRDVASDTVVGDAKLVGLTIEYGRA